jgi:hypothetical protein
MAKETTGRVGSVSSCSATDCRHNQEGDCIAPSGIRVAFHEDHAECETYDPAGAQKYAGDQHAAEGFGAGEEAQP